MEKQEEQMLKITKDLLHVRPHSFTLIFSFYVYVQL